jgi:hypothetical protein
MRTRACRILSVLVLMSICVGAAYLVGYGRGYSVTSRKHTKGDLRTFLALYGFEQNGDTNRLHEWLRFLVFTHYDYYTRHYASGTESADFLQDLAEARVIAMQQRTNLVHLDSSGIIREVNKELQTNRVPNTALEPTPTAP